MLGIRVVSSAKGIVNNKISHSIPEFNYMLDMHLIAKLCISILTFFIKMTSHKYHGENCCKSIACNR